jgi:hypothetical protein
MITFCRCLAKLSLISRKRDANASHVSLKRASVNSKFLARARQRFPRSSVPGEHIVARLIVTPHSFRNIPSFA